MLKLQRYLGIISKFSGKGLILPVSNPGKMSINAKNTPWDEILYGIPKSEKLNYDVSEKIIVISTIRCN